MIQLLPLDDSRLEELLRDFAGGLAAMGANCDEATRAYILPALQQTLDFHRRTAAVAPWQGYLGVDPEERRLAGICGFKGKPNAAGEVEIAYGTMPGLEGRGYATQMAQGLVKIAWQSPEARRVIAHTLPEANASARVLKKAGLKFAGEVIDPEDGRVWRWEIDRAEAV
jgi:RimJ/RimL family protein N-acetyltransferase